MTFDITNIVKLIIEILVAVASLYVIPWLKLKFGEAKIAKIVEDVEIAVAAAEQIAKRDGKDWHWKKERVIQRLEEKGYTIDEDLDDYVEAKVLELHNQLVKA